MKLFTLIIFISLPVLLLGQNNETDTNLIIGKELETAIIETKNKKHTTKQYLFDLNKKPKVIDTYIDCKKTIGVKVIQKIDSTLFLKEVALSFSKHYNAKYNDTINAVYDLFLYIEEMDSLISLNPLEIYIKNDELTIVFNKTINIDTPINGFYFFLNPKCNGTNYYSHIFRFSKRYKSKFTYILSDSKPMIYDVGELFPKQTDDIEIDILKNKFPNLAISIKYVLL